MDIKLSNDKKNIVITLPYDGKGTVSQSTKTLLHASEKSQCLVDGKEFTCQVNGYSRNPAYVKPAKA